MNLASLNLLNLNLNQDVTITGINGPDEHVSRILDLGLFQGLKVAIFSKTSFGGPIVIQTPNQLIALRKEEAECIQVML